MVYPVGGENIKLHADLEGIGITVKLVVVCPEDRAGVQIEPLGQGEKGITRTHPVLQNVLAGRVRKVLTGQGDRPGGQLCLLAGISRLRLVGSYHRARWLLGDDLLLHAVDDVLAGGVIEEIVSPLPDGYTQGAQHKQPDDHTAKGSGMLFTVQNDLYPVQDTPAASDTHKYDNAGWLATPT